MGHRRSNADMSLPQSVHQMHQDHVPILPEGFESLGSTEICPVHGMVKFVDLEGPKSLGNVSILTLQGSCAFSHFSRISLDI